LINESDVGLISARTLQNAGTSTEETNPGGNLNGPAATLSAAVIVVSANFNSFNFSQFDCADTIAGEPQTIQQSTTAIPYQPLTFILFLSTAADPLTRKSRIRSLQNSN
jgi:hypothetical protein